MNTAAGASSAAPLVVGTPVSELPSDKVRTHAFKLAIDRDKPIQLDYYRETRSGSAFLGEDKDTKEKILVKNAEEYTSPVTKMYKVAETADPSKFDYIIETENSIYIVSGNIKKKEISSAL
jgi:hypothetical protein